MSLPVPDSAAAELERNARAAGVQLRERLFCAVRERADGGEAFDLHSLSCVPHIARITAERSIRELGDTRPILRIAEVLITEEPEPPDGVEASYERRRPDVAALLPKVRP